MLEALRVDNTNANNSITSRWKEKNPNIFIAGCPCHLAHLVASEANDSLTAIAGMSIKGVLINLFNWFNKSWKQKEKLAEYYEFCNQEYQQVLKHISVCWLSLERCIDQVLKKLPILKSYFESVAWWLKNFKRGQPLSGIYKSSAHLPCPLVREFVNAHTSIAVDTHPENSGSPES